MTSTTKIILVIMAACAAVFTGCSTIKPVSIMPPVVPTMIAKSNTVQPLVAPPFTVPKTWKVSCSNPIVMPNWVTVFVCSDHPWGPWTRFAEEQSSNYNVASISLTNGEQYFNAGNQIGF